MTVPHEGSATVLAHSSNQPIRTIATEVEVRAVPVLSTGQEQAPSIGTIILMINIGSRE